MKKIYLLLVCCLLIFVGDASGRKWYSRGGPDITNPANWWNTRLIGGFNLSGVGSSPYFDQPNDTFIVQTGMQITAVTWDVQGTVIVYDTLATGFAGSITKGAGGVSIISVGGALVVKNKGRIHSGGAGIGGTFNIYLRGDLYVQDSAYIGPNAGNPATLLLHLHFSDTSTVFTPKGITWTSDSMSSKTALIVDSGSVRVLKSRLPLPTYSDSGLYVKPAGTLMCDVFTIGSKGIDTTTIDSNAFLYTKHTSGLDSSIQQMALLRYSNQAHYIYNGTVRQVTGITLPGLFADSGSVMITNNAGVALSQNTTFGANSHIDLDLGQLVLGNTDSFITMNSNSFVNVDGGTFSTNPIYQPSVDVTYKQLGTTLTLFNLPTKMELQPVTPGTIGNLTINKTPTAIVQLGSDVVVGKDLVLLAGTLSAGSSPNNHNISVRGNWINNATVTSFNKGAGTVIFDGTSKSFIKGTANTKFNNFTMNNAADVEIQTVDSILGLATFIAGKIYTGNNDLFFGPTSSNTGSSNSSYVVASTMAKIRQQYAGPAGTFTSFFPVGDSINYSPLQINISASLFFGAANVGVNLRPEREPHNNNQSNYLNRYWTVGLSPSGFLSASYRAEAWYQDGDVVGVNGEDSLAMGEWNGSYPWKMYDDADKVTNHLTMTSFFTTSTNSNFTGISKNRPKLFTSRDTMICSGASIVRAVDSSFGDGLTFTWSPATGLSATTGTTVTASPTTNPVSPTVYTYTITATDANGFSSFATTTLTVNPAPTVTVTATPASICLNDNLSLTATGTNIATYLWSGPVALTTSGNSASEMVNSVTPSAAGIYTVTVTNGVGAGCTVNALSTPVTVNPLPPAPSITTEIAGVTVYCGQTTITGVPSTGAGSDPLDIAYSQGTVMGFTTCCGSTELITTPGTAEHFFRTQSIHGCWSLEAASDSIQITVNAMPDKTITATFPGIGHYCAGGNGLLLNVGGSETGVTYTVHHQPVAGAWVTVNATPGTGSAFDFGPYTDAGDYLVDATNATTGCADTINTGFLASLAIDPLPNRDNLNIIDQTVTYEKRGYCVGGAGLDILLANADAGTYDYLLYKADTVGATFVAVDSIYQPSGGSLDFGIWAPPGEYMAIYSDPTTGCRDTALTTDSLWVNPLPNVYNILPGDASVCYPIGSLPGFPITLDSSETAVFYTYLENGVPVNAPGIHGLGTTNSVIATVTPTPDSLVTYVETVQATDTNNCSVMMNGSVTINFLPLPQWQGYAMAPHPGYCPNEVPPVIDFITNNSEPSISYQMYYTDSDGIGPMPIGPPQVGTGGPLDFGVFVARGNYAVLGTNITSGCIDTVASDYIWLKNMPGIYTVSGGGQYCAGGAGLPVFLSSTDLGAYYDVYVDGGYVTTVPGDGSTAGPFTVGTFTAGGTYTVNATSSDGCIDAMPGSATIVVNPLPLIHNVTGGGDYCNSTVTPFPIELDGSETGISYVRSKDGSVLDSLSGTGGILNYGLTPVTGTYTVTGRDMTTGCSQAMSGSATVTAHNLPDTFTVTGGGSYCNTYGGVPVGLTGSKGGITYHLYLAATEIAALPGTGAAFNFPNQLAGGTYTITATNDTTGCFINMAGATAVNVLPLPTSYLVAGAGIYCAGDTGRHVYLSGSTTGIRYDLYQQSASGTPINTQNGVGMGLDFGLYTAIDSYYVVATNIATTCSLRMAGTVGMQLGVLPTAFTVSGGGSICAGATGPTIGLSNSNVNIGYQLLMGGVNVGSTVDGTGSGISFGTFNTAGTYQVTAVDLLTGCYDTMSGSANVVVNPLPTPYSISGGGAFCEGGLGKTIIISNSETGVNYQPLLGGVPIGGPWVGTGTADTCGPFTPAGCYTIHALNTSTLCASNMTGTACITVNPLPVKYSVIGGGSYCAGDTIGLHIDLSNSDPGINYQLMTGTTSVGGAMPGTHLPVDFGSVATTGSYFVTAADTTTGCADTMNGTANIAITPDIVPTVSLNATPSTVIRVGNLATVTATVTGAGSVPPTFKWTINRNVVPGANTNVMTFAVYYDNDTIDCYVTSNGTCAGYTTMKEIIINLIPTGIRQILSSGADIKLLPNPNKGTFSLKGTTAGNSDAQLSVEVTNMLGQSVYTGSFTAKNGVVDEHIELGKNLANGMYLLNLRSGTDNTVFHFVVEK